MADHLTFLPEKSPSRNVVVQILFEIIYGIIYFVLYIPGLLVRPGDITEGDKRAVVLVSGFFGSPLTWLKCRAALAAQGHPVYVVRLGFQFGNLRSYSEKLQRFLEENNLSDVYLVCHSMGGLVAAHMGYRGRDRTRKIFTLGTPFRGHPLTFLFPVTFATLQMNPLSPFMRETKDKYRTLSSIQAVFARFDEILFLKKLNIPGRFDDVKLAQIGHANLFMGPAGIECITELIAAEEAKDPKPVPVKDANGKVLQATAKVAQKSPARAAVTKPKKPKKAAKPKPAKKRRK
ncbi:esterase/lipase family protein [Turneriella parva]|uniref:Hydrolase or acyltransferase n=1 Tax=Turneriella parva (strain ATCC BAA-1111 / DSM 21527 / NCTC 11395 / H) TaxID=869212 RepID=I4B9G5_TURPD|nr:alpha/beta hydrolase [Turneriella parva]AFM13922.1 hydrolase or acyltransferase [Turneriella parva DSM 21527]